MKLNLIIAGILLSINFLQAQTLTFNHGEIEFYTASIMSDIEAITQKADVKLDVQNGNVEVIINIKSFAFESETMQKHFNDEYMESEKFPQASFMGKIVQDISNITEEAEVDALGKMTIHGVAKEIQVKARMSKKNEFTVIECKIPIVFKDYNVEEPSILTKSVAKDVLIKGTLYLK